MINGLIGKKLYMSQVYNEQGKAIPVTIMRVGPCWVTQVKTEDKDGYTSVQVGFEHLKPRKLTKPMAGHLQNLRQKPRHLSEFSPITEELPTVGQKFTVTDIFDTGEKVDISGRDKGRGFAGVMKRWGFSGGPRTHGQSDRERAPGSIGAGTYPGKVFKGKKMPGRMGNKAKTISGLTIVAIDTHQHLITVKGAIPGHTNSLVYIKKTKRAKKK